MTTFVFVWMDGKVKTAPFKQTTVTETHVRMEQPAK